MDEKEPIIIKKIIKKSGGGHGGSWKVAYADFVTAMMAFFLLMWLVSALSKSQKQAISQYFKTFSILKNTTPPKPAPSLDGKSRSAKSRPLPKAQVIKTYLKRKIEQKLKIENRDQLIVTQDGRNIRIEMTEKVGQPIFEPGSSRINAHGIELLNHLASTIKHLPYKIAIEGHTDARSYTSNKYTNWELSSSRASDARRILYSAGISDDQIAMVIGYAANNPLIPQDPENPRNRRISIIIFCSDQLELSIPNIVQ